MQKFTYRNPKILKHAKWKPCQNCAAEDNTTVAAHSNHQIHGKGKGIKAHDLFVAFLCYRCHAWLDHGIGKDPTGRYFNDPEDKRAMFLMAMTKTQLMLLRDGVLG